MHPQTANAIDRFEIVDGGLLGDLLLLNASIHPLFAVTCLEFFDDLIPEIAGKVIHCVGNECRDGVWIGHRFKKGEATGTPSNLPIVLKETSSRH